MKRFSLLALVLFLSSTAFPVDLQLGGSLKNDAALNLPDKDFILGGFAFEANLDASQDASVLNLDAAFSYDALSQDDPLSFKVKEAWYDYATSFWSVRIGRQINAWGKADGLSVCDILCPKDYTALLLDDYTESRLGIDAARLSISYKAFSADAYWIPFFTPAILPQTINTIQPERKIENSEYALRLSAYLPFADFSLYGFYGYDDEPLLNYTGFPDISGKFEKMTMVGADAAIPFGQMVLRLEAAFFPKRKFALSATRQVQALLTGKSTFTSKKNEVTALAGIDWMPSFITMTAQYYCDYLFEDSQDIDREDSFLHQATLSLSKSFFSETLTVDFSGIIELNEFSSFLHLKADYAASDQISFYLGYAWFLAGPDKDGAYGLYKDMTSLLFGGKYSF